MQEFTIPQSDSDQTLIKYLSRLMPCVTQGFLFKQLRTKNILLNDSKATGREKLKPGDVIKIYMRDETIEKFRMPVSSLTGEKSHEGARKLKGTAHIDISCYRKAHERFGDPDIRYEDDNVLVFVKPSGLLSQKAEAGDLSANEWIIGYLLDNGRVREEDLVSFTPSVCNRLDRNTAGLMLFGKTVFGTNFLNRIIKDKSLRKYYITVAYGRLSLEGTVTSYLLKDHKTNKVRIFETEVPGSSPISTVLKPLRYNSDRDLTLVEVLLNTGKSHQIRAQLAHLGHPVYGDVKYMDPGKARFAMAADTDPSFVKGRRPDIKGNGKGKDAGPGHLLVAYRLLFPANDDIPGVSGLDIRIDTKPYLSGLF